MREVLWILIRYRCYSDVTGVNHERSRQYIYEYIVQIVKDSVLVNEIVLGDHTPAVHPLPDFSYHPRYLQTLFHMSASLEFVINKGSFDGLESSLDIPFPHG
jgi:hypothetical protein